MIARLSAFLTLMVGVMACSAAYRDTSLFHNRIISEQPLPAEEYAVYSAALREFLPDKTPTHDWSTVTGVTIRPDEVSASVFRSAGFDLREDLLTRLNASGDTVYAIADNFSESLNVVISDVVDTTEWVPIRWHRVRDRPHFAGLISLSRVVFDDSGQSAIVYGLWGTGTLGTGFPRVVLLHRKDGLWVVTASKALEGRHEPSS